MKLLNALKYWRVFSRCAGRLSGRHLCYMAKMLSYERVHAVEGLSYVNSFFPAYPSAAFEKFLDTVFERKRVPYSVYFAVTDKCPYSCGHCSYGNHTAGSMDTEQAIDVIKQICGLGSITVGLTGGEPLMRKDIVKLVEAVNDDCGSVMFTTGFGLTADRARELKEAGLKIMTVGFEWDEANRHDRIRGVGGSFDIGLKAVAASLGAGMFTAMSTVATHEKLQSGTLFKMAEMADRLGVHEFRILEPVPTGSMKGAGGQMLSEEESREIAEFHKSWNRKGKGVSVSSFSHLESDEMFGCGAGYYHLFVDAVGNVCPCDLTPLAMGNVFEERLADIWERMGQWFGQARCGCFMRQICDELDSEGELPLGRKKSEKLSAENISEGKMPRVFDNLFNSRQ